MGWLRYAPNKSRTWLIKTIPLYDVIDIARDIWIIPSCSIMQYVYYFFLFTINSVCWRGWGLYTLSPLSSLVQIHWSFKWKM